MESTKEKIINKIKETELKPRERWQFQLREFLVWFGLSLIVALAALAFATVIFNFANADWMMRRQLGLGMGRFIFMSMPYVWLLILVGLIGVSYYAFRQTKNGYQYALPLIAVIIILLSIIFGWMSHRYLMSGRWIESGAQKHMPMYQMMTRPRQAVWMNPEKGFLIGQVISSFVDNEFKLSDINRKVWLVSCDECLMPSGVKLNERDKVKIIGEKIDENNFIAEEVIMFFRQKEMGETRFR